MKEFHILNLGAGVQSTALFLMAREPDAAFRFDVAVFADTGEEPATVYKHLDYLRSLGQPEIWVRSAGRLGDDLIHGRNSTGQRFVSIPAFTKNPEGKVGMVRRQCTAEYKIEVVNRTIRRDLLGLRGYFITQLFRGFFDVFLGYEIASKAPAAGAEGRDHPPILRHLHRRGGEGRAREEAVQGGPSHRPALAADRGWMESERLRGLPEGEAPARSPEVVLCVLSVPHQPVVVAPEDRRPGRLGTGRRDRQRTAGQEQRVQPGGSGRSFSSTAPASRLRYSTCTSFSRAPLTR